MPHYYFCLRDDESVADTEGMDLPDLDAARDHASTVARELTFGRDGMLDRDWSRWTLLVSDSDGQEVLSLALADFRRGNSRNGPSPVDGRGKKSWP